MGIEEDERTGIARRPVVGLPIEELELDVLTFRKLTERVSL